METQEPIFIGPILPASIQDDTNTEEQSYQASSDTSPQENIFVKTMDAPLSNLLFNVITLINTILHFSFIICIRLSFRPGGWFYNLVFQMTQMSLMKSANAVRLMEPLITLPPSKPFFILDQPIEEETDMPTPTPSTGQLSTIKILLIILALLILCILFGQHSKFVSSHFSINLTYVDSFVLAAYTTAILNNLPPLIFSWK